MNVKYRGRPAQTIIYLGKLFRMFLFQNDWKVLPMAALIAGLVAYVTSASVFQTMEGTLTGTFALTCICIWNGFFNSIQVIVRERPIIKREHRAGLHMTSYVFAHMIYQALLCLAQAVITIIVSKLVGTQLPEQGVIVKDIGVELIITFFLITYAADMMALLVSAIARTTTAAMTVMPFLLIVQLVFAGAVFPLNGPISQAQEVMISKWGMRSLCIQADYNNLKMVSVWNSMFKMKNVEIIPGYSVKDVLAELEKEGKKDEILYQTAKENQVEDYNKEALNLMNCWFHLIEFSLFFAFATVACLEFIDKDKRQ